MASAVRGTAGSGRGTVALSRGEALTGCPTRRLSNGAPRSGDSGDNGEGARMREDLTVPVFERLRCCRPQTLAALVNAGLLDPAFALYRDETIVSYEGRLLAIERLMTHDAYRRVRGAIRQVRWAG